VASALYVECSFFFGLFFVSPEKKVVGIGLHKGPKHGRDGCFVRGKIVIAVVVPDI